MKMDKKMFLSIVILLGLIAVFYVVLLKTMANSLG